MNSTNKIKMATTKKLGIWMDHANAHVMEFSMDSIETTTIDSNFTHADKVHSLNKSERLMHNKEQQQQGAYYEKLGHVIRNYESVLLFGPTDAKTELLHVLRADHRFADINIDVETAGRMTENQEHAFVKKHFSQPNL